MGRWKKGRGRTASRMTPLPKRRFVGPSYGTFSTPLGCRCSVFPVQKSMAEQTRSSFGGGPIFFGRARSLVRWPLPPYVLHPPYHGPTSFCVLMCSFLPALKILNSRVPLAKHGVIWETDFLASAGIWRTYEPQHSTG